MNQTNTPQDSVFRTLFEAMGDPCFLCKKDGFIIDCNRAAWQLLGYPDKQALINRTPEELSPPFQPDGRDSHEKTMEMVRLASTMGAHHFEWTHLHADGTSIPIEVMLTRIVMDGEEMLHSLWRDLTSRKQAERAEKFRGDILESLTKELLLPHTLEAIVVAAEQLISDSLGSILLMDSEGQHLGHGVAPHLPDFFTSAISSITIGPDANPCGRAAFTGQLVVVEDFSQDPTWSPYQPLASRAGLAACWAQPILSSLGKVLGTFTIYYRKPHRPSSADISLINQAATLASIAIERAKMEEQVLRLAYYDELTHLPNRRLLMDRLQRVLSANSRSGRHGALLFIDLDNFKSINDTLGHDAGDVMLHHVALRLVACVRHEDTVARLGGDEFVVMLENLREDPATAAKQTESTGDKILAALRAPYFLNNKEQRTTPSIGAVVFKSKNELSAETLIKQADIAMYHAKQAGRDALYFFNSQMEALVTERVSLASDLHDALDNDQFVLFYQIQVDQFGKAQGAEALIRWDHPTKGLVSPLQFIPLAEETGLIVPIGLWVLNTACAQIKVWQQHEATRNLTLAVNVSARQFLHPNFVSQVNAVVEHHAIDPRRLKLELTESMLATDVEGIIVKMNQLQAIGIRFSLDDFGTGYSSLQYIKRLPLNQLKIDQSFVNDIETNLQDRAIVRTIIATAKSFNLNVIAEGVETIGQKNLLITEGCFHFQGYLFSKPVPIAQFSQLLQDDFVT